MSAEWGSLPLLSLKCVLDHLSLTDALAALSTCRHWRNATLLYEGRKDVLILYVSSLERNLFITKIFKKYTKIVQVIIDSDYEDLENFMNYVLPQFFETQHLQELVFIGPVYLQQRNIVPASKINRVITESLMFKNEHCLQRFTLLGCVMGPVKNENDRLTHKHVEYYSRPFSFKNILATDTVYSSVNAPLMALSSLQHLTFDCDLMSTSTLRTISLMGQISDLTLTVGQKRPVNVPLVDWSYAHPDLRVTVIIITVPRIMMNIVIEELLLEGLPLYSLKVLFCETLHTGVLQRVVNFYKDTIRELVWVDSPATGKDACTRVVKDDERPDPIAVSNVNPLLIFCWQCSYLRRIIIHGYWLWEYDILGIVRLLRYLKYMEISAIYDKQCLFTPPSRSDHLVRVMSSDIQIMLEDKVIRKINSYTKFEWAPIQWVQLHPALRYCSTRSHRIQYVLRESLKPVHELVKEPCE